MKNPWINKDWWAGVEYIDGKTPEHLKPVVDQTIFIVGETWDDATGAVIFPDRHPTDLVVFNFVDIWQPREIYRHNLKDQNWNSVRKATFFFCLFDTPSNKAPFVCGYNFEFDI